MQNDTPHTDQEDTAGSEPKPDAFGVYPEPRLEGDSSLDQDPATFLREQETVISSMPKVYMWHGLSRTNVLLIGLVVVMVVAAAIVAFTRQIKPQKPVSQASEFGVVEVPLKDLVADDTLRVETATKVSINGGIELNGPVVIGPSVQPTGARAGQLYFDEGTKQLAYFNGDAFVFLSDNNHESGGLQSLNGAGQLALGDGLRLDGTELSNTGVITVQGQRGAVAFSAGPGILLNGTSIVNNGVIDIVAGTPNVSVVKGNDGRVSISVTGVTGSTLGSSGGTTGAIPVFTAAQNIEDSIITQSGLSVSIGGSLHVATALEVASGGTGLASLPQNALLIGQGSSAVGALTASSAGLCLISTASAPIFAACPGGGGTPGVASFNGLTGVLTLANSSGSGSTITINDATISTKGIASFDSANFVVTNGLVSTVQNISTGATPIFAGVSTNSVQPSSALTVGSTAFVATLQGSSVSIVAGSGSLGLNGSVVAVGAADATGTLFVLDTKTGAGDPTGVAGGMYYNASSGKFRCYQNGAWVDCVAAIAGTPFVQGGNSFGATAMLGTKDAQALNFITNNATVASLSSTGAALFQNATNSTAALSVKTSVSTNSVTVLNVDTTNARVGVGTSAPRVQFDVAGSLSNTTVGSIFVNDGYGVVVSGKYAYVAEYGHFNTYDVSRPSAPVSLGNVSTITGIASLRVSGKYAFVVNTTWERLYIIDVGNPSAPVLLKTMNITGLNDVAIQGKYMYVGISDSGQSHPMQIYDISNAASPTLVSSQTQNAGISRILVRGNYAYLSLSSASQTLQIVDVSDPENPIKRGTFTFASYGPIALNGSYLHLASSFGSTTVQTVNIANPSTPTNVGSFTTGFTNNSIVIRGKYMYLGSSTGDKVQVVDVTNVSAMSSVGFIDVGGHVQGMDVQGTYLYLGDSTNDRMKIYDVGGAYLQQLEAGSIATTTLQATGDVSVSGAVNIQGGLHVDGGLAVTGSIGVNGSQLIQTTIDTASAFRVLNAATVSVFTIDTSNARVYVGNPTADTTGALLVLDAKTTAGDPSGVNGGLYYNSAYGRMRCYEGAVWSDCSGIPRPNARRTMMMSANGVDTTWGGYGGAVTNTGTATATIIPRVSINHTTAATAGSVAGSSSNAAFDGAFDSYYILYQTYAYLPNTSSERIWLGIADVGIGTMGGSATPNGAYAAFRYDTDAGDTTFKCVVNTFSSPVVMDSGIAATVREHRFEIVATYNGVIFRINDSQVCNITSATPLPSGNRIRTINSITALSAASRTLPVSWIYVEEGADYGW